MSQGQSCLRPDLPVLILPPPEKQDKIVKLLSRALHRIRTTPPRIIASPATRKFMPVSLRVLGAASPQNLVGPL